MRYQPTAGSNSATRTDGRAPTLKNCLSRLARTLAVLRALYELPGYFSWYLCYQRVRARCPSHFFGKWLNRTFCMKPTELTSTLTLTNHKFTDHKFTWFRPLRTTCLAYRPTSQPFSARNCRREHYLLGKRTFPKFFVFFVFCDALFFFSPVFLCFTFFHLRKRVLTAVRFWFSFLNPQNLFPFCRFFSLFFRFSLRVRGDKARQHY